MALLSSATFGSVAVIDKRLIDRHMPTLSSYFLWVAFAVLTYGLIFLAIDGIPESVSAIRLLVSVVSGLCWGGAMALMFWGLKLQEATRASAMIFTFPVFVAILATFLLGDSLVTGQWIAIGAVVAGAILISSTGSARKMPVNHGLVQRNKSAFWNLGGRLTRAFPVLIGASLLTAFGHLTGKYALQELSVWLVASMGFFGTGAVLLYSFRPRNVAQLLKVMRQKEALLLMVVSEVILVPIAVVSMIAAIKLGPVALVATLTGTRPLFVFVFGTVLSIPRIRFLNESTDRKSLTVKLVSVALILVGIVSL